MGLFSHKEDKALSKVKADLASADSGVAARLRQVALDEMKQQTLASMSIAIETANPKPTKLFLSKAMSGALKDYGVRSRLSILKITDEDIANMFRQVAAELHLEVVE